MKFMFFVLIALMQVYGSYSSPANETVLGPLERDHQILSCMPGRAVFDISWKEQSPGYRQYSIRCANFTAPCYQSCHYSTECTVKQFGPNLFIGGIYAVYDRFEGKQIYLLYLCCNTTSAPNGTKCSNRLLPKEGKSLNPNIPITFRAAKSTYPDGTKHVNPDKIVDPKLYFEVCEHERGQKVSASCPLLSQFLSSGQSGSGSGSGSSLFGYSPAEVQAMMSMAPAIVLSLATPTSIAALALSYQTATMAPGTDPCCCNLVAGTTCFGLGNVGPGRSAGNVGLLRNSNVKDCHAACAALPACVHGSFRADYIPELSDQNVCFLHDATQIPTILPTSPPSNYCLKKAFGGINCDT